MIISNLCLYGLWLFVILNEKKIKINDSQDTEIQIN